MCMDYIQKSERFSMRKSSGERTKVLLQFKVFSYYFMIYDMLRKSISIILLTFGLRMR